MTEQIQNKAGYVLAYRRAWTHPAFKDLLEAAIWNFLYQNAFYEDGERNFNGTIFHLKRGQIVVTPRFIAEGFRVSERVARNVIQKLRKCEMLSIKSTNKGTIITICNYEKYQRLEKTKGNQNVNQEANKGQSKDANNNEINKRNKDNKDIEGKKSKKKKIEKPDYILQETWNDFLTLRKEKKAPVTETVLKQIKNEADKINWTMDQALSEMCLRGWQGFKAEWINNSKGTNNERHNPHAVDENGLTEYSRRALAFFDDENDEGTKDTVSAVDPAII